MAAPLKKALLFAGHICSREVTGELLFAAYWRPDRWDRSMIGPGADCFTR